jgi:predicted esterase
MKNLLVYLHGFGSYNHENAEFQKQLANKLNAHLLSPQAEMPSGRDSGGFAWHPFSIDCKNDLKSVWFVGQQALIYKDIDAKLKTLKMDWDSVILSGRGQGAFIALKTALGGVMPNPKIVMSFNGYYIDEGPFQIQDSNKKIPILWLNSNKDNVLSEPSKNSHHILTGNGINTQVMTLNNSDHDVLSVKDIAPILIKLQQMGIQR